MIALLVCSEQFAWANGRFDNIFSLKPESCAGAFLQPFVGIVGTSMTVLGGSFFLRNIVNAAMQYTSSSDNSDQGAAAYHQGLGFGVFEYAVIKTVHLGLCQAAGCAISVALYTPVCGPASQLIWALAMCWLLSVPVTFTLYLVYKLAIAKASKEIRFYKKMRAGSWIAYFSEIWNAEGSSYLFCRPHIVHYLIKVFFAVAGALLLFLAVSFASDPTKSVFQTVFFFVIGSSLLVFASTLSCRPGRKLVVSLTNVIAAHLEKRFVMLKGGAIVEERHQLSLPNCFCTKVCSRAVSAIIFCFAWIQAKVEAILDPYNIWILSHRGRWVKKNELKVYYTELNDRGIFFALFVIIKNVIIGITTADSPSLVGPVQKVQSNDLDHQF